MFWYAQNERFADLAGLKALYDGMDDPEVKSSIIFALSQRSDDPAAVDMMLDIARTEDDPEVQESLLFHLGQSDDPRIVDFLLEIIRR